MIRSTPTNKKPIDLSYAIREIIIVSIGILIAFGINTCSSNLSQSRKYKEYTKSLIADLDENLKNIDAILYAQQKKVTDLNRLVDMLEHEQHDMEAIGDVLYVQRKSPTFFPVRGTFQALVSQGEIQMFSTGLKRELFNLYNTTYERTEYNGELYDKIYVDVYDKEIHAIMNLKTKTIENKSILTSPKFVKDVILIIDEAESYISLLMKCKVESEKLRDLIEAE